MRQLRQPFIGGGTAQVEYNNTTLALAVLVFLVK